MNEHSKSFPDTSFRKPHLLLLNVTSANSRQVTKPVYLIKWGDSATQQSLIRCCGTQHLSGDLLRIAALSRRMLRKGNCGLEAAVLNAAARARSRGRSAQARRGNPAPASSGTIRGNRRSATARGAGCSSRPNPARRIRACTISRRHCSARAWIGSSMVSSGTRVHSRRAASGVIMAWRGLGFRRLCGVVNGAARLVRRARRFMVEPMSLHHSQPSLAGPGHIRNDWTRAEVEALFALPFPELMFEAARIHRLHFDPSEVQISTLLSIKTGGCPEDCAYCPQAARYDTGVKAEKLMELDAVLAEARAAKAGGAIALLHGRGLAFAEGPRRRERLRHGRRREGARARDLRHARHADAVAGRRASSKAASTTTTTTSTPRRSSTARSSPRGPTRIASTRSTRCAPPASMSAAAASSAWARARTTAPA